MTTDEMSAIRSRYLGVDKKKRKIRKMSDKKFVFDWDEQDDTFNDASSVASALAATPGLSGKKAGAVMFGRGHLAGMDDGGVQEANTANRHADAIERRRATKGGNDERHWTEKQLSEMKDRDWRIFREDFSIATRGKKSSHYWPLFHFLNLYHLRWPDSITAPLMGGIYLAAGHTGGHRDGWIQGAFGHPAAGNSYRSAVPRSCRYC